MHKLLTLLLFLSFKTLACGGETKEFSPFSTEIIEQNSSEQSLKVFEILSPIQKGDTFLSSITAHVEGEFQTNLDVREDYNYVGNYYSSYLSVPDKHLEKVEIILAYNTTKKDRSNMILCGNFKQYKLTELIGFKPAQKAPQPPPSSPGT